MFAGRLGRALKQGGAWRRAVSAQHVGAASPEERQHRSLMPFQSAAAVVTPLYSQALSTQASTTRKNRFKAAIASGERQIGLWTGLRSTLIAEMLTRVGYDWIVIDMEHSPNELNDVLLQLQVTQPGDAEPMVRVPWNEPVIVKRVLDLGCQTILFPLVNTAEEARQAVAATRYPTDEIPGVRGVMSLARMNSYGMYTDYYQQSQHQVCVIVQAETIEAVNNIPEIAKVPGVDGIFVGPSDLSASMGFIGNAGHPDVQAAIKKAIEGCQAAGKPAGFLTGNEADAKKVIEMGYTFVAVGSDMLLLTKNATSLLGRFKEHVAAIDPKLKY